MTPRRLAAPLLLGALVGCSSAPPPDSPQPRIRARVWSGSVTSPLASALNTAWSPAGSAAS